MSYISRKKVIFLFFSENLFKTYLLRYYSATMPVNKGVLRDFSVVSKKNVVTVVSGCSMQNHTCLNKYLLHEKSDKQRVFDGFLRLCSKCSRHII